MLGKLLNPGLMKHSSLPWDTEQITWSFLSTMQIMIHSPGELIKINDWQDFFLTLVMLYILISWVSTLINFNFSNH